MSAGVVSSKSSSCRATAHATRRHSVRVRRERWPERRRRRGAEGPTVPNGAGAGATAAGVAGTGPDPVGRHGWSSAQLVMHMR
jgi:hypothetical protein